MPDRDLESAAVSAMKGPEEAEKIAALVAACFKGNNEGVIYDACTGETESAWEAILEIVKHIPRFRLPSGRRIR